MNMLDVIFVVVVGGIGITLVCSVLWISLYCYFNINQENFDDT